MSQVAHSDGILERLTSPTLRSLYLFGLMQITQNEIDPSLLHDTIHASASMLQRATLNMLELDALLKVRIVTARFRWFIKRGHSLPTDRVVTRTLGHADRLLMRRSSVCLAPCRRRGIGGIPLQAAKLRHGGGIRRSR